MPDSSLPPFWRNVLRVNRAVLYASVLTAGLAGIVLTPQTIVGVIGELLTLFWTTFVTIGAAVSLLGVLTNKWWIERVAVWLAAGGMAGYASVVWGIVATGSDTRTTQASVVTGLTVALAYRGFELAGHAAMLRRAHTAPLRWRKTRK